MLGVVVILKVVVMFIIGKLQFNAKENGDGNDFHDSC